MGNTIGTKIVIDGEKEYRQALQNIGASQKELRSEMKLCTAEFSNQQNSLEALSKKHEILSKQIEKQNEKVELYSERLRLSKQAQIDAGEAVNKLSEKLEAAQSELNKMRDASDVSAEALEEQERKVKELSEQLGKANNDYAKAEKVTIDWQTSVNNANAELLKMNGDLDDLSQYMKEASESTDGCAKSINEYGKKTQDAGSKAKEMGEKGAQAVDALAETLVAAGVAQKVDEIKDALIECAEVAAEFETAVAKIDTIADKQSKSLGQLRAEVLEQSSDLGIYADEIADATYNAISASVETSKAVEFAGTSAKLAVGGFTDATTSVDVLTTSLNAYNLSADEAVSISDMLITTQNLGKTTVAELAASLGKVIPIAAAYNVNMANLSTSTAILTANGIATAEAVTYQKAMLNELGDTGSDVADVLSQETGKSFAQLTKEGKSLGDVIDILGKAVGYDKTQFNALWSSSEAGVGALSLLGSGASKFNTVLDAMKNSTGATEKAFNTMANTSARANQKMEVSLENLKIAIGSELNPALVEMYETGENAFEWAAEFVEEYPEVVNAISALVVALGVFTTATVTAKAALLAFNAVLSLPTTAVTLAAIGGITSALVILGATADEDTQKFREMISELNSSNDVILKNIEERQTANNEIRNNAVYANTLADSLDELSKKEQLTAAEQYKIKNAVSELNRLYPTLNLEIDSNTGKLKGNTEELRRNIEQAVENEKVLAIQEKYSDALKDSAEAEANLLIIQDERAQLEAEIAALEEKRLAISAELEKAVAEGTEGLRDYDSELGLIVEDIRDIQYETEALDEQQREYEETVKKTKEEVEQYNRILEKQNESLVESSEATEEATTKQIMYHGAMHDVSKMSADVVDSMEDVTKSYYEAKQAADESISAQVGLFEDLAIESSETAREMKEGLESQTAAFNQYKDDLLACASLVEQGVLDEGLLGALQQLGIEGAGYVHELATASAGDLKALSDSFSEMNEARNNLTKAMADIQTDYTEQMDALLGIQTEKQDVYKSSVTEHNQEIYDAYVTAGEQNLELATQNMQDINEAYEEGAAVLNETVDNMLATIEATTNTKLNIVDGTSLVYMGIGKSIPTSMAKGVDEGTSVFVNSINTMIDKAVNAAVAKAEAAARAIDRALGSKMK